MAGTSVLASSEQASSFDSVLNAGAEQTQQTQQTQQTNTNTNNGNGDGGNDLLALLAEQLGNKSNSTNTTQTQQEDQPDYLSLFNGGKTATQSSLDTTNTTATASTQDGAKATANPNPNTATPNTQATETTNQFISSINDDEVLTALVAGITPMEISIPEGVSLEVDEHTGFLNLTPEVFTQMLQQSAVASQQQSLQQTIRLVRELIPAVTEQAQASAVSSVTNNQQHATALSQFNDNPALKALAGSILAGQNIEDGAATANKIKALMSDIVKNEHTTIAKTKPKEQTLSTFLGAVS